MIAFEVNDMTCGHCVSTITKALKATDRDAKVQIDLATHRVQIEPNSADAEELAEANKDAGYTPVPILAGAGEVATPDGVPWIARQRWMQHPQHLRPLFEPARDLQPGFVVAGEAHAHGA